MRRRNAGMRQWQRTLLWSLLLLVALTWCLSANPALAALLNIAKPGGGDGVVTSDIGGIHCGSGCADSYLPNTLMTLTATPDAYSTFVGWDAGVCAGQGNACELMTGSTDETVAAYFRGAMIAAGNSHTVALKSDGTVWSWGWNQYGQLGDGTTNSRNTPVQVSGLDNVLAIAAGFYHTVALKSDGTVWSWGWNQYGQLGDGTTNNRNTPVQVSGLTNVLAIAAGHWHTVALKNDGSVWVWGDNGNGQLGNGVFESGPHPMPTQSSGFSNGIAIAADRHHVAALKNDGTVWTWGSNHKGQLGDGMWPRYPAVDRRATPSPVNSMSDAIAIAAGEWHMVALKNDGTVWTWGFNQWGQLGDGTTNSRNTPVQVLGLTNVLAIAAGVRHTVALKNDGSVWSWGHNSNGQLGNGIIDISPHPMPTQASGLRNGIAVAVGGSHTVTLKSDGTVWAWGIGGSGELGDGTKTDRMTPVQVLGASGVGFLNLYRVPLTVSTSGFGFGTVSSNPGGIDCDGDCEEEYLLNTVVTLTATPDSGSAFAGWSGNCSGTGSCTLTMDAAKAVGATFSIAPYTVTLAQAGSGSGTVGGGGSYAAGTTVTLTATPAAGSHFAGWSPSPCAASFTMPEGDLTCTATFARNSYTVTTMAGTGGSIAPLSQTVAHGATTTFTITPASGYVIDGATGCGGTLSGNTYTTGLITGDCTVSANFTVNNHTLTVNQAGNGDGTVGGGGSYAAGTTVTLTATPSAGSHFVGWSPSPCAASFTMPDGDLTCTATFTRNSYTLTVNQAGSGDGTVGGGGSYPYGTLVAPTAAPMAGSLFAGWTPASCGSPFALLADTTCTATFTRNDDLCDYGCNTLVGLHHPVSGYFALEHADGSHTAGASFRYGPLNTDWIAIVGDWDGDGVDTVGLYNPHLGQFYLRNAHAGGAADIRFRYGPSNAGWIPLAGDWDGNGIDTVGLYDPHTGTFYLRNAHAGGVADVRFRYGPGNAGWEPIAGDWNGDWVDTVGLYNPSQGQFYLRNAHAGGAADMSFRYGPANAGWEPLAGDWDADGQDTVGLYRPQTGYFYLRNTHTPGVAHVKFQYGATNGEWWPLAGKWH